MDELEKYICATELLKNLTGVATSQPNKLKLPINRLGLNKTDINTFNNIYLFLKNNGVGDLILTPSRGIAYSNNNSFCYTIERSSTSIDMLIHADRYYRIQLRGTKLGKKDNEKQIYGRQAFCKFKDILKAHNINLDNYIIENGSEVKKEIKKPLIKLEYAIEGKKYLHCYHIDFHSSYPAGLINTHPEFKEVITEIYNKRKDDPIYKAILNYSIGFMQSEGGCGAKWAHLSKDAINDNYNRVIELSKKVRKAGYLILDYNTDGFWYCDIKNELGPYHGIGEGSDIGCWSNDHVDCIWRCKSAGSYEFIENEKYYPVVRGMTRLDDIKPRDQWQWGDIFNKDAEAITFYFDENKGVIYEE